MALAVGLLGCCAGGVAELKGRVTNLPTTWVMLTGIVASQVAMAGISTGLVFAIARALGKG